MQHIAIIEDDRALNNGIVIALRKDEYQFKQCFSIKEAKELQLNEIDLIILDLNLPDGNGLHYLQDIRKQYETPVIILSANDLESDEVMGLDMGADDYITKPFSLMVLRARIDKVLKHVRLAEKHVFTQGNLYFDFEKLIYKKNNSEIELSKAEQKLLRYLIAHKNQTLTREQLISHIWTDGLAFVEENALSVTIKRLRDKIEEVPSKPSYIQTVYGIGYVWRTPSCF